MGEECSVHVEMRNAYRILVLKPQEKRSVGRPTRKKAKTVPQHAMEELGGRGDITPSHS
jgi:hypothetical protein